MILAGLMIDLMIMRHFRQRFDRKAVSSDNELKSLAQGISTPTVGRGFVQSPATACATGFGKLAGMIPPRGFCITPLTTAGSSLGGPAA